MKLNDLFFIIGVGRSGTSLLQSILTSHSKMAIPPETGFVRKYLLKRQKQQDFTFKDLLKQDDKLKRVQDVFKNDLEKAYSSALEFYKDYLRLYLQQEGKELIGDKDPRLVEFILATSQLFPTAKYIHLIRDPRDVLLSKKKADWSKSKPSWYHIFANYVQLKLGEQQGRKLSPKQYICFIYENLLSEPKHTAEQLCDFLEVPFEINMLSFQDKAKELVSEEEKQWKKETLGPLLKNNSGKWKGKLTDKEVALTECLCKQAFQLGGYEKSDVFQQLSFLQKINIKCQTLFFKVTGVLYMQYRLISQKNLVRWKY